MERHQTVTLAILVTRTCQKRMGVQKHSLVRKGGLLALSEWLWGNCIICS